MARVRGFEFVKDYVKEGAHPTLPTRSTRDSAGYDLFVAKEQVIPSIWKLAYKTLKERVKAMVTHHEAVSYLKPTVVPFYIKAYMGKNEVLYVYLRSSAPKKFGLILANQVGIIDADYYGNEDNDGNIGALVYNLLPWDRTVVPGTTFCQCIFSQFLAADEETSITKDKTRTGGVGSTGNHNA